jgi:hypothetical protein
VKILCWVCERLLADRGGICHLCRQEAQKDPEVPRFHLDLPKFAGVLLALVSLAAGLLAPAVVSPRSLPFRSHTALLFHRATPVAYVTTMVEQQVKRKVYPYSIVPGGAEDVRQAKLSMSDPAIKGHYAGIDLAHLKQVKLTANLSGYVSYRWGDKIYWTAKRITLRVGETVYTDGTHIVRGRCLNCYSALPMSPIRPHEPTEAVLDSPVEMPLTVYSFPRLPLIAPELPIPPGELTPVVPVLTALAPTAALGKIPRGGFWFPLIPIIPPIHRHPSRPTSPGAPLVPPPILIPPVVVPEPSYGWVLAIGFLAMIFAYRLRRPAPTPKS